jgi:hypothetical protein
MIVLFGMVVLQYSIRDSSTRSAPGERRPCESVDCPLKIILYSLSPETINHATSFQGLKSELYEESHFSGLHLYKKIKACSVLLMYYTAAFPGKDIYFLLKS